MQQLMDDTVVRTVYGSSYTVLFCSKMSHTHDAGWPCSKYLLSCIWLLLERWMRLAHRVNTEQAAFSERSRNLRGFDEFVGGRLHQTNAFTILMHVG